MFRPFERNAEVQVRILEALMKGEKRFSDLLVETRLTRPTLASNLDKLQKKGYVKKDVGSEDHREKLYSITEKGVNAYNWQRDIEQLSLLRYFPVSVKGLMQVLGAVFRDLLYVYGGVAEFLRLTNSVPPVNKRAQEILGKCVSLSIYVEASEKERVEPLQVLKEFVQFAVSLASSQDIDLQRLKRLPNLSFVFQFNSDKLMEEYWKKFEVGDSIDR